MSQKGKAVWKWILLNKGAHGASWSSSLLSFLSASCSLLLHDVLLEGFYFIALALFRTTVILDSGALGLSPRMFSHPEGLIRAGFPLRRPCVVSYKGGVLVRRPLLIPSAVCAEGVTPFSRHGKFSLSDLIQLRLSPVQ